MMIVKMRRTICGAIALAMPTEINGHQLHGRAKMMMKCNTSGWVCISIQTGPVEANNSGHPRFMLGGMRINTRANPTGHLWSRGMRANSSASCTMSSIAMCAESRNHMKRGRSETNHEDRDHLFPTKNTILATLGKVKVIVPVTLLKWMMSSLKAGDHFPVSAAPKMMI